MLSLCLFDIITKFENTSLAAVSIVSDAISSKNPNHPRVAFQSQLVHEMFYPYFSKYRRHLLVHLSNNTAIFYS